MSKSTDDLTQSRGNETTHISDSTVLSPKSTMNSLLKRSQQILESAQEDRKPEEVKVVKYKKVKKIRRKSVAKRPDLNPYSQNMLAL